MIITYYGDGKGKTTAALGLALRASGTGKKVKIIQFIKGKWKAGEEKAVGNLPGVSLKKFGLGFVNYPGDKLPMSRHKAKAAEGLSEVKKTMSESSVDLLILDEINWAVREGLLKEGDLIKLIKNRPKNMSIVLTGSPKINELIEISDITTEMKKIKHPFDLGELAEEGIDY